MSASTLVRWWYAIDNDHGLLRYWTDDASGSAHGTTRPGSIRLTASTLRLVEGLVQVTALGRFRSKG